MNSFYARFLAMCFLCFSILAVNAANGDTVHIKTHDKVLAQTNPSVGHTDYLRWGVFPSKQTPIRKILLNISFACPSGMTCGEWDYLNHVYLRRKGGIDSPSMNIELTRLITPYGLGFNSKWRHTWQADITEFEPFLHDSVEIDYRHTGYEVTAGRGWLVTLDFEITKGTPVMEFISMDTLWNGSKNYGNATNDFENYVATPRTFTLNPNTKHVRTYLVQTGHGGDPADNCGEFCSKYLNYKIDGNIIEQKTVWRTCGDNPVFPQNGTWIYDRANWCPGDVVDPYRYDTDLSGNHAFSLEMEARNNPTYTQGNYVINSYLFQYKAPWAKNDVSIEDILEPSTKLDYKRENGTCSNPKVIIKNNGSAPLTSVVFEYGSNVLGLLKYKWTGNLAFSKTETVTLPNYILRDVLDTTFTVKAYAPNGLCDEYEFDNSMTTSTVATKQYPSTVVFVYKTTTRPQDFGYQLTDVTGTVLYQKIPGSITSGTTTYRDTFRLDTNKCYNLRFTNVEGYGLGFWAMASLGTGLARLQNNAGAILKTFATDFGSYFVEKFRTGPAIVYNTQSEPSTACTHLGTKNSSENNVFVRISPNPTKGVIEIDAYTEKESSIQIQIVDITGKIVAEKSDKILYNKPITISLEGKPLGMYIVKTTLGDKIFTEKILVE